VITAAERWQIVKQLLSAALDREPSERSAYLDQACTEPSLRQEVKSLIAAHAQAQSAFLEESPTEGAQPNSGVRLGSYEIIEALGAGGMGVVYRAKDSKLPRQVALKILPPILANDADALTRFRREADMLASLSHPNVVTIYEIGEEGHTPYIAMEYVEGRSLSDALAASRMRMEEVFDVATQIAEGLAFAHRSRIVHRDLKPRNIVIRRDGLVKILDFGLGKLVGAYPQSLEEQSTDLTGPKAVVGTIDYMSPQQAAGLPLDFRSDQFSFGSVLYEMATGKRPFHRPTVAQTLSAIMEDEPLPPRSLNPQVTPALDAVIRRCLRKDPADRYASTDELARELREGQEKIHLNERLRPRHWPLALAIALACSLAAGAIWTIAPHLPKWARTWTPLVHTLAAKNLVILPFTNVGDNPANQAFCDGVVEILSSKLSQLQQFQRTLRVVPATDVLQQGIVSAGEARKAFGANLVITGSVQQTQGRVRMTINLVDPRQVRLLESKTIDTEVRDVSTLQDGVVLAAAELLDVKLTSQAEQVLAVGGTTVPDAYQYYAQGRGYLQRYEVVQNLDDAASLFKLALAKDPNYALAEAGLAEAYWRKYELTKQTQWADEARKASEAALKLNNKLPEIYVTLGMIDSGTGHDDEAIQNLHRALELDPLNSDAYRGLAQVYQREGRLSDSEATYLQAIAVRPGYWGFHNDLGGLYFRSGDYADAEKQFQSVVELTPDNARGYSNLGAVAYAEKRYEAAAEMFEKATAIKPTSSALSNLGTIYYTLGQYSAAARYYERAIQLSGDESEYWHNLAAAYQWSNQPDKARAAFRRTAELAEKELRVNPKDPVVLLLLADAYSNLDQPQPARQLLERGLALAPNDVFDMFQASVIYERLGKRDLALQWLAKAIKGGFSRDLIEREPSLAQLRLDRRYQGLFQP
jgi:serine/threonine protein kinase/tetratricopeptide (TPR) repeat protein